MITAQQLYEAHARAVDEWTHDVSPLWDELSFDEQCDWQEEADAQNDRDKETSGTL